MNRKRKVLFTIIRSLLAILIALLVATILIFISTPGATFKIRMDATGEALKQMLAGPVFRFSKKNGIASVPVMRDCDLDFHSSRFLCGRPVRRGRRDGYRS